MFSFRKPILTAVVLSLALALPTFAADAPAGSIEKYLPDGSEGVVTINIRQLLDSELIKKVGLDKTLAGEDVQKTLKSLGLDPLKDVERIIITGDKDKSDESFVIIEGKFDPAKLDAAAESAAKEKSDHVKVHKMDHGKIYELTRLEDLVKLPPQAAAAGLNLKGRSVFVAIPDKGHIVFVSSKESAETVLAKAAGKKTTKLANKDLAALLAKINTKQSVAVVFPAPAGEEKVKSITGGITVTSDMKSHFTVAAADADAAKQVDTAIGEQLKMARDLVGLVTLQEKGLAPILDIIDGIKHDAKDGNVAIRSDIKGETLQKVVKALAEVAAKQGGINK